MIGYVAWIWCLLSLFCVLLIKYWSLCKLDLFWRFIAGCFDLCLALCLREWVCG